MVAHRPEHRHMMETGRRMHAGLSLSGEVEKEHSDALLRNMRAQLKKLEDGLASGHFVVSPLRNIPHLTTAVKLQQGLMQVSLKRLDTVDNLVGNILGHECRLTACTASRRAASCCPSRRA